MELRDLSDKQKALIDPRDRAKLGKQAQTYDEAEADACVKLHRELQNQIQAWCNRQAFKSIFAPTRNRSGLPVGHPDCSIFGPRGLTMFCEIKVGKDVLSTAQENTINALRELGHMVVVTHTYEFFIQIATNYFFKDEIRP